LPCIFVVKPERELDPLRLRFDAVDLADRHAKDAYFVAGVDAVGVGGGFVRFVK
jgi:hypothetical protein